MRYVRLLVLLGGILAGLTAVGVAGSHPVSSPYFPLAQGNAWVYTVFSSLQDSIIRIDTIRIDDMAIRHGQRYYHLTTPWFPLFDTWLCPGANGDILWCDAPGQSEHPFLLFSAQPGQGWLLGGSFCVNLAGRVDCTPYDFGGTIPGTDVFCFKSIWRPGDCNDAKWRGAIQKDIGPIVWIMAGAGEATIEWNLVEFLPGAQCDCKCHADPRCDGVSDVLDLAVAIDVAFCGMPPPTDHGCWCYAHGFNGRTDVDCSGATDILDIIGIVNVIFAGADPAKEFCDPSEL